ncbi:lasso peptide biosynthesis B2 protein [Sphingomonas sp. So64.6b]|uniref:lasso peptide biosynthesis B2 protein n=1 Tax=Sphingomonas sp. So64.6b TaxID=2997354 RepID=UPI00160242B4|nr:lasso peptide biosynthesis B2 protein [Sphingomonas sp. So64.6b]QNA85433.1 lasso peptide biosynthesis B2 protein [Sphingomonas sp. So64.6b]
MSLVLRSGLSWCICTHQAVFLDLPRDRYFCLSEALDSVFQRWAAGEPISLAEQELLVGCGVIEPGGSRCAGPAHYPPAMRDYATDGVSGASFSDVLAAMLGQLRAQLRLKRLSLASIVSHLTMQQMGASLQSQGEMRQRRIACAFGTSAMLLRAADRCLPRAIAARQLCHRHGQAAALIFGVRLNPFAAHSWVQSGDAVIVGDLEQVRLYTPILVVR